MQADVLVVGAGFAGAVSARELAEKGQKVVVIDRRDHIGGNAYDYMEEGIRIHQYGPHIFHTSHQNVYEYLSRYTEWYPYQHHVLGHIRGKLAPIPFNFESIDNCFTKDKAERLRSKLQNHFPGERRLTITELLKVKDPDIKELADFVFENVFKHYTMKQWGIAAEDIDPAVVARVPIKLSYKDGYFDDKYQVMPKDGYTPIFQRLLAHPNITLRLEVEAKDILDIREGKIWVEEKEFTGKVIYTGMVDELFDYALGELPYRSLDFVLERHAGTFQREATENYPGPQEVVAYTRITEYKHLMNQEPLDHTFIHREFPLPYQKDAVKGNIPYYPIFTPANQELYHRYVDLAAHFPQLFLLGRLAEYKYYNMDTIVARALQLSSKL